MQQALAPAPPQAHSSAQDIAAADNDLRVRLALAINPPHSHSQSYADALPAPPSSSSPRRELLHLDPSMNSNAMQDMMGDSGGEDDRKGSKRELSQSKRAAQNRAAQRAFRQRKEGYIKKLEEQVREYHTLEENFKAIQTENYSLREYIIHLQSRLIESHGEYPQPPANVNLHHPPQPPPHPQQLHHLHHQPPAPQPQQPLPPPPLQQHVREPSLDNLEERALVALQASASQAQAVAREGLATERAQEQSAAALSRIS